MEEIRQLNKEKLKVNEEPLIREDEINLARLWLIVVRRKRIVALVLLLSMGAALAYASFMPKTYRFSTTVELGQNTPENAIDGKSIPIENVETTLAKINSGLIPVVIEQFAEQNPDKSPPKMAAHSPKGSDLVVIEAKGSETDASILVSLLREVADRLVADHNIALSPVKRRLDMELAHAKLEMGEIEDDSIFAVEENVIKQKIADTKSSMLELQDEKALLVIQRENANKEAELLAKQIDDVESSIATALKRRSELAAHTGDTTNAVTLLMLSDQIQRYQDRIASLSRRLTIGIPEKRRDIANKLENNKREQYRYAGLIAEQEGQLEMLRIRRQGKADAQLLKIKEIESRSAAVQPTRVIHVANRSVSPLGSGPLAKLGLGLVIGLMLGVLTAVIVETFARAKPE